MAERKLFKVYGHGEWPGYNGLELFEFDEMMTLDEAMQYSNDPEMLKRLVRTRMPKYTRIDCAYIQY